ncbi:helix-turn-helix domain-containing protein [Actinomadura viridis]|uniref:helix-turn-helix domain-containing protein n=1 Tax=Actinomadura viridis TaxID=58110 RepID=UPI0036959856
MSDDARPDGRQRPQTPAGARTKGRTEKHQTETPVEVPTPAELAVRLRRRLHELGLSQAALAGRSGCHPSTVSRVMSGKLVPTPYLARQLGRALQMDADGLVQEVEEVRRQDRARRAAGGPPADLRSYDEMLTALRQLLREQRVSQRELERLDPKRLRRSTVGAVLRGERSASHEITIAIVTACRVTGDEMQAWHAAWQKLGRPYRARAHERRVEGMWRRRRSAGWTMQDLMQAGRWWLRTTGRLPRRPSDSVDQQAAARRRTEQRGG